MTRTTCHMSISLDGFVAGAEQSREKPLGKRGMELHSWHLGDERANDADATAEGWLMRPRGAYVMGRNMFGPIRGEWDEDWDGWWGSEPPYHAPVFVLTHHARPPIEMEGGTSFHFVTEGFEAAYAQARETAGEDGIDIAGGASTVRQALNAGVIDELTLDVVPVLLGSGERLFDGVESLGFEPVEVLHSPLATHIRYRRAGGRADLQASKARSLPKEAPLLLVPCDLSAARGGSSGGPIRPSRLPADSRVGGRGYLS